MGGRTERVNARDIAGLFEGVVFEGDVVRGWVKQLLRRGNNALDQAQNNDICIEEMATEIGEMEKAIEVLEKAEKHLAVFIGMVQRRGGRSSGARGGE